MQTDADTNSADSINPELNASLPVREAEERHEDHLRFINTDLRSGAPVQNPSVMCGSSGCQGHLYPHSSAALNIRDEHIQHQFNREWFAFETLCVSQHHA
ncbi:hypothetical protein DPX16_4858 [Anabarilius grahami]|uniref:Uncharacterized protein n=1 Tax=Anabarilius grahami TaxID=495550 RepID=A0A3N0Y1I7_ANAGA|nr:hypothetical protein DPX16_4858 [Anabarilius grahami]